MRITEPMTMLTDYVLGALALVLALRLHGAAAASGQLTIRLWAFGFVMTAVAAFVGGTYHGFIQMIPPGAGRVLWKITLISTGVGSASLLGAAVLAAAAGPLQWALLAVVVLKLLVFLEVVLTRDNFLLVVLDYGSALIAILLAAWFLKPTGITPAAGWLAAGVGVSVVAGAIQAFRLAPHPRFNHNDLFHVVQLAAIYCLYRGGLLLRDMK
jgi:hypothetical protein